MALSDLDVAVVGAGPYGLSVAAHLNALGVRHRVFGDPMETWREHMPKGMWLKSDPFASWLFDPEARFSLEAFCDEHGFSYAPIGWPVPLEMFVEYGMWFQKRTSPDLDRRKVGQIESDGAGFRLTLEDGEALRAKRVVVCAGISHFSRLPAELGHLPPDLVSHSALHADPGAFAGRDVTILGAGASALDLAMLMHEAGVNVRLVARAPQAKFGSGGPEPRPLLTRMLKPRSGLGAGWSTYILTRFPGPFRFFPDDVRTHVVRRVLGPAAGAGVRERIEGKAPFLLGTTIECAEPNGKGLTLRLAGPHGHCRIETEHLVAATGYHPDIEKLSFLAPDLRRRISQVDASPRLDGAFQSSVPNLFFAGLAAANTFGPLQRFAYGARFAARRISAKCRTD
jgi:lysine/ornithine N-monooxygenase